MTALWRLTILETKMFFREKVQVFWTFLFPVLMIWLFGSMFGNQDYGNMTFASYFVPSWIGVNIVTTAFFTLGTVLTGYRETGVLRRYQSTPIAPWKILFAHTVQGTVIFSLSAVVLIVFGSLMLDLHAPRYLGSTLIALVLAVAAFFPFALFITSLAKNTQTAAAISSLFLNLMLFLSGATFPLDAMPNVLQYVAKILPLYYVIDLMRASWNTGPIWEHQTSALVLLGISVVSIFLASKFFRWSGKNE
ncbi:ABC transporter permease [Fictibacillus barbaricus]|uniref:Transport permease protein n=1 Tax=Fictibacillus barbaricus TaxID=182136 RepID=A0ABU1U279_9BACL|nr:ABC transporter permease [Fictibacillus barbaricus]MDR7073528.1 ABC-2 type transport system permease protein [Fictibacillus barbaricus]